MNDTKSDRKNVVFLVLDSLRKDRISPYNEEVEFTSNIQEIAKDSIKFERANAQAPWTLPSTASIFTGEYPWEHGATNCKTFFETEKELLVDRFKKEGYRTKVTTSNPWISHSTGLVEGFDEVENFLGLTGKRPFSRISGKLTRFFNMLSQRTKRRIGKFVNILVEEYANICKSRATTEDVKEFFEDVKAEEDFFLFINLMSPHEPYNKGDPPKKYLEKHGVENPEELPGTAREFINTENSTENLEKAYDASVDYTDDLVGEIRASLEENGLKDDTVLVILSDHGQAVGKNGIFGHQFTVMDRVIETPLIIDSPEEEAETREELFELRSLYKLLPDLAGISDAEIEEPELIKGSYEFPEFIIGWIPDEKQSKLDKKLRFVKDREKKIVKSIGRDGSTVYSMKDLDSGDSIEVDEEVKEIVDGIGEAETESKKIDDEEVKDRLEKLGYM